MKNLLVGAVLLLGTRTTQAQMWLNPLPVAPVDTAQSEAARQHRAAMYKQFVAHCPYAPAGQLPVCTGGHTDHIIPIIYGMVMDHKLMRKAKRGEVELGGCMVSECDPHYHCVVHDKYL